jgi:hypothetical protein
MKLGEEVIRDAGRVLHEDRGYPSSQVSGHRCIYYASGDRLFSKDLGAVYGLLSVFSPSEAPDEYYVARWHGWVNSNNSLYKITPECGPFPTWESAMTAARLIGHNERKT